MTFTTEEILLLLAVIGVVVFLAWTTTILEVLTKFNDWMGKKLEEQRQKNQRTDEENK